EVDEGVPQSDVPRGELRLDLAKDPIRELEPDPEAGSADLEGREGCGAALELLLTRDAGAVVLDLEPPRQLHPRPPVLTLLRVEPGGERQEEEKCQGVYGSEHWLSVVRIQHSGFRIRGASASLPAQRQSP